MKNILFSSITMVVFVVSSYGQTAFSWSPNDTILQTVDPNLYTELDIHQINLTGDTLELGIEVVYNDIPASWDGMICIQGLCLGSIHPAGFTAQMVPIYDTIYGYTKLTVFPQGGMESCKLRIRVYDVNNPIDGDTCTWILNSATNTINELDTGELAIFPNPASDMFKITSVNLFDEVWILDFQGRRVRHVAIDSTYELAITIDDLPMGEYFVEIFSKKEIIKRLKLITHE
ncbi:MAG: T9SS type A sorting domain-containing protein [Crocinitomicaceae bacterium]|jgi:hypothetical protein|nr:T9SS type A sorting domain-containing protein [Crocinitomicaceae bacterium]